MPGSPELSYRRVADELRRRILSGEMAEGDPVPSLNEIVKEFGVNRNVAAQALAVLRAEGLVMTRQGARTYVRRFARIGRKNPGRLLADVWRHGKAIQDQDTGPRARTVDVVIREVPAPDYVAEALSLPNGRTVLERARRFLVEDRPVQLASSFLPLELVAGTAILYTDTGKGGIYARLDERGFGPTHFRESVIVRSPEPDETEQLELSLGGRVYQITRLAFANDRCVEVARMILDVDAYELISEFSA